jgi:hypothetical protein
MPEKQQKTAETLPDVLPADSEMFDDVKPSAPASQPVPQINSMGDMLSRTGKMAGDVGKGMLKGIGNTVSNIGHGALNIAGGATAHLYGEGSPGAQEARGIQSELGKKFDSAHTALEPANTAESIGKGVEQVGEFLVPGGAEKAAAAKLGSVAPKMLPLIRPAIGALSAGAVNKAQGGDFTTGAVMGGGSGALSEGMRAIAPSVMKSALRVGSEGLEYDRNTGKSVLEHTTGFKPGTISRQAQDQVGVWSKQLDNHLSAAPDGNLAPIRHAHDSRIALANYSNSPTEQKLLEKIRQPLHFEYENGSPAMRDVVQPSQEATGVLDAAGNPIMRDTTRVTGKEQVPIPAQVPAHRLRAIKQGVGSEVGNFAPQNQGLGAQYKKAVYGDIDKEINRVAPESAELDSKMSSLIPAIKAGQKVETAAPISSRVLHRMAAHTGAAVGGIGGAMTGYQHGGMAGAIIGGATGLIAPEMMVSPEMQAMAARALYSPATPRVMRAVGTPVAEQLVRTLRERNKGTKGTEQ